VHPKEIAHKTVKSKTAVKRAKVVVRSQLANPEWLR
jgi:hypothetical protein